jgi:(1->4)-alpha-D-glucan 1-alpha-D-glucosylmutase
VNGLVQTVLKATLPGVPDFYQGTEFWDLSLLDPDNRGPVDFVARAAASSDCHDTKTLTRTWRDGRIKQAVIARCLAARRAHAHLFASGEYVPLIPRAPTADHLIAYARRTERSIAWSPRSDTRHAYSALPIRLPFRPRYGTEHAFHSWKELVQTHATY